MIFDRVFALYAIISTFAERQTSVLYDALNYLCKMEERVSGVKRNQSNKGMIGTIGMNPTLASKQKKAFVTPSLQRASCLCQIIEQANNTSLYTTLIKNELNEKNLLMTVTADVMIMFLYECSNWNILIVARE